jgi:hypothetical protein
VREQTQLTERLTCACTAVPRLRHCGTGDSLLPERQRQQRPSLPCRHPPGCPSVLPGRRAAAACMGCERHHQNECQVRKWISTNIYWFVKCGPSHSRRRACSLSQETPSASAGPTPERPGGLCKTTCSRRLLQRHLAAQRHLGGRRHGHDVRCSQLPAMCGRVSVLRAGIQHGLMQIEFWGLSGVGNPQPERGLILTAYG